ncbi:MAG: 1-(5-phosphoribosyl)-5-[(5-phosphoribosylamino)methylideneamino]imidazole-4-carboxamide isomerase [Solirubrobacterales bacterium]|nr:1-(5-phosphoribosyl)-5-[(5-phosphoribosylamino)methylideneamino]imidazole-4-carboxamide isomerase [Solirubrobacterales bacterium]
MILLPAIDILDGRAVRLARGEFHRRTEYDSDPVDAARRWASDGARRLHVVDLDGARSGAPVNLAHVRRIVDAVEIPVQVGGGLRSGEAVDQVLETGAERAVLGTAALRDPELLERALAAHPERIVVSVDARRGRVAAAGWTEQTEIETETVIAQLGRRGASRWVYSSIERDGMLAGPDLEEVARIARAVAGTFVYSGGVSTLDDLRALAGLGEPTLEGVIVGTALYERRFGVAEGQAALTADDS